MMIKKLFTDDLYIKVYKNKLEAKSLSSKGGWTCATPAQPFTTERLLTGNFSIAESVLTKLVTKVLPGGFIKKSPRVVIHPMEMVEGGLSEVEDRMFKELALSSGAFKVMLHTGPELTDAEAKQLLRSA